ncbi:MAG: polysaccharide deacetylase family protein [Candidatus Woesearchaeota archaeon]|nr:polysaccharide deacetylase family protein [Candidatus Woesearchaeota archaeon]
MKTILLTFDVEEFDLPKEFGLNISKEDMSKIPAEGVKKMIVLLKKHKIMATFFATAYFALKNKNLIKQIKKEGHEIALHGYLHEHNYKKMSEKEALYYLKKGKQEIEKITGTRILGFRAPRMMPPAYSVLQECGIKYDSSIHPTYIPGRYNYFFKTRKITIKNNIVSIPLSTTPLIRLPFSWLWFRNLGLTYAKFCTLISFADVNFINLFFHPWDFINLKKFKLPFLIKNNTGDKCINMLENYILWCKKSKYEFKTIGKYLNL